MSLFLTAQDVLLSLLPAALPLWAGAIALAALLSAAVYDARYGIVPPTLIVGGAAAVFLALIFDAPQLALSHTLAACLFYAAIWLLNEVWYRIFGHDALGMGDASWSFLAVLAFGWQVVIFAWGAGAILALLWLGARQLCGKKAGQVYFAPFLMAALLLGQIGGQLLIL